MTIRIRRLRLMLLATAAVAGLAGEAFAQEARSAFNIPAQDATTALQAYARQSGKQVLYDYEAVRGRRTSALQGDYTDAEALSRLLSGAGLVVTSSDDRTVTLAPAPGSRARAGAGAEAPVTQVDEVVVTGSRIRGSRPTAAVVSITQEEMRLAGHNDLGEAIRAIPQNFSGGQNPGVLAGATAGGIANQNITGSAGFNLRGLGPDASLTLLNGMRLPYDSAVQASDVTVVPVAAIERVEILLDGASAIYVKALAALRERIASGALNGGDPVVVMLEAEALDLSPTPLREALARLEGEGLVRRVHRGGYRVAQLGAGEIAEHYRFQSRLVATSLEVGPFQPLQPVSGLLTPEAAASALADLLGEVVRRPGDRAVRDAWLASTGRMARIRRRESGVLEGLVEEFEAVSAALGADAASASVAVGKVYRRRIEAAGRLSDAAAPAE